MEFLEGGAAGGPAIVVDDLVFEYPEVRALDRVSFSIPRGSITALVGPNGAGKTTLLRCIAGLTLPLSGRIRVDGIDVIAEPRRSHRRLGYLSDTFGLYETLTVARALRYAAEANGVPTPVVARAVREAALKLGLSDRLGQRCGELSRGLRQRVAIGQAIIHRPAVILLDEPAAGLDPEARHELSRLFRLLRAEGMTLLVSSHILAELAEYSTDMLVLKGGRVAGQQRVAAQESTTLLQVTLAAPHEEAAARLAAWPAVSRVEADGLVLRFVFGGDAGARHRLLKGLIDHGIPVCELREAQPDMQASYLASVGGHAAGRAA